MPTQMKKKGLVLQVYVVGAFVALLAPMFFQDGGWFAHGGASWEVLVENAGIASMHSAVTHYGTVVMLDRTDIGPSFLNLSNSRCRNDRYDLVSPHDCTAHSIVFSPSYSSSSGNNNGYVRPLFIATDTWCSSGQFFPDGTLVQTGGDIDGITKVRQFAPCPPDDSTCDWSESASEFLQEGRWYATNQLLPDGRQIIVGGRAVFTYEFIPSHRAAPVVLPFLQETNDPQNDNYYPFVHLLPDGNLFIFANRDSIVYDYQNKVVVRRLPTISGEPRNYPSAGSSVMLPLRGDDQAVFAHVEIMVCGGAKYGAFLNPTTFPPASDTCGRISLADPEPAWRMETMPIRRAMGDILLLPQGQVLIINGVANGCQGWGNGKNAILNPVIYNPEGPFGARFTMQTATSIPRVYHSTANLLPDGRVLVAGSNTHQFYTMIGEFPTELRVEAFSPDYLARANDALRPIITNAPDVAIYGQIYNLTVVVSAGAKMMKVSMMSSPFTTHSFSQGLRQLWLSVVSQEVVQKDTSGTTTYTITIVVPLSPNVAPPSYYMLFVVNQGIPSKSAVWLQITHPSSS